MTETSQNNPSGKRRKNQPTKTDSCRTRKETAATQLAKMRCLFAAQKGLPETGTDLEGIVGGEVDVQEIDASSIGAFCGTHDGRLPLKQIISYGACAAVGRGVLLQIRQFLHPNRWIRSANWSVKAWCRAVLEAGNGVCGAGNLGMRRGEPHISPSNNVFHHIPVNSVESLLSKNQTT
eukprot:3935971-Rhodomonas_salina.4